VDRPAAPKRQGSVNYLLIGVLLLLQLEICWRLLTWEESDEQYPEDPETD
jgi:hypothetical protein